MQCLSGDVSAGRANPALFLAVWFKTLHLVQVSTNAADFSNLCLTVHDRLLLFSKRVHHRSELRLTVPF